MESQQPNLQTGTLQQEAKRTETWQNGSGSAGTQVLLCTKGGNPEKAIDILVHNLNGFELAER